MCRDFLDIQYNGKFDSVVVTNLYERALVGLSVEDSDDAVVLARRDDSVGHVGAGDVMAHHLPTVVPTVAVQLERIES